jgi:hypothetical protein
VLGEKKRQEKRKDADRTTVGSDRATVGKEDVV